MEATKGKESRIWDKIKEFKEIVALLIFFAGGVIAAYNYVATKADIEETKVEIRKLDCRVQRQIIVSRKNMEKLSEEKAQKGVLLELTNLERARKTMTEEEYKERKESLLEQNRDLDRTISGLRDLVENPDSINIHGCDAGQV